MSENQHDPPIEIPCEAITDDLLAFYQAQGYTLVFSEEIMRYTLSHPLPIFATVSPISYLPWNEQNTHAFFTAYQEAFRERPGFPNWSEAQWLAWVAGDPLFRPDLSFLASMQGQTVGFVTNSEDEDDPAHAGYLIQVGVHPAWRGQRIGAALTLRSLQAWQEAGKSSVLLHVNSNNPTASRLYRQLGFEVEGLRGKFRR